MNPDWLQEQAQRIPTRPSLVYAGREWDFRALDQAADQLASRLTAAGVRPGDFLAVLLPNRPEFVFLIHAAARLGAVLAPLNTRLAAPELAWQLEHLACRFLVSGEGLVEKAADVGLPGLTIINLDDPAAPADSWVPDPHKSSPTQPGASPSLENLQAAVFTSGTTGRPKAVQITFGNHFFSASASAFRLGLQPGDRWLAPLPLYHVGGLALVFRCLLYGIPLVLQTPARSFDPQALLECIERDQVTIVSLVPTMLERLLEIPGGAHSLARLRFILLGGAAAPEALLEQSLAAGLNLALTYGMTETTSQIATSTPQESRAKPGSAGKPLLFYQLRILDEHGTALPAGQTGQIAVAGPTVTPGYFRPATAEQAASELSGPQPPAGFLLTGDLGYLDSDGDLWVLQRRADLIVSGGENIYPAEVERVLLAHPAVAQACVVGLEAPGWGQQVAAAIVLRPASGLAEAAANLTLIAHCRARLAGYKIPRRFLFLDQLPQTASGKILRAALVESFTDQSNESNYE